MRRIASIAGMVLAAGLAVPARADEADALEAKSLENAKALAAKVMPTPADLGEGWKRPWEVRTSGMVAGPGSLSEGKTPSESAYWEAYVRGTFPVGLPEAHVRKMLDAVLGGAGVPAHDAIAGMLQHASRSSRTAAQRLSDEADVMSRMGRLAGGSVQGLDEGRATLEFLNEKHKGLSDPALAEAFVKAATRIDESTRMEFFKSNDWKTLLEAKSDRDLLDKGVWIGAVTVTVSVVKSGRESEVPDLAKAEAPALEKKITDGYAAVQALLGPYSLKRLQDDLAKAKGNLARFSQPTSANESPQEAESRQRTVEWNRKEIERLQVRIDATQQPVTAKVLPRDMGDNSYVVRLNAPAFSEIGRASVYTGWLRNGRALVEITFGGNFPEAEMNKEMDHFLQELDARTALYRE